MALPPTRRPTRTMIDDAERLSHAAADHIGQLPIGF
jgi:hypothetical protein